MNPNNLYTPEELDQINKTRESNDKMEEFFKEKRDNWSKNANVIFDVIKMNLNPSEFKNIVEAQALSLSYRQTLNEEISYFLNRRSREEIKFKKLKQSKFLFYSTGFGLKTNLSEKTILIDGHTSESERTLQIIEVHIQFLRDTVKSLESFQYSIKNLVSLYEYLGGK
jgi:hypothetical protein